jgi:hypothetical protein
MSKLLQLIKSLPLDKAADFLSEKLNEKISQADIVRLAIDGHLVMSIRLLANTESIEITNYDLESLAQEDISCTETLDNMHVLFHSPSFPSGIHLKLDRIKIISGVFELAQTEATKEMLEHKYNQIIAGSSAPIPPVYGGCLTSHDGKTFILVQPEDLILDLGPDKIVIKHKDPDVIEYSEGTMPSNSELCLSAKTLHQLCKSSLLADDISPTREKNFQYLVGLLTEALADKSGPKGGSTGKPNYNGLSEILQEYLPIDDLGNPSKASLSIDSLRKKLKTGHDALYKG